jgi:hypothetical protein
MIPHLVSLATLIVYVFAAKKGRAVSSILISDPRRIKRRKLNDGTVQDEQENQQIGGILNNGGGIMMNDLGVQNTFDAVGNEPLPYLPPLIQASQIEKKYPGTKKRSRQILDASRDINNRSTFSGVDMRLYETAKANSQSE